MNGRLRNIFADSAIGFIAIALPGGMYAAAAMSGDKTMAVFLAVYASGTLASTFTVFKNIYASYQRGLYSAYKPRLGIA